MVHYLENQNEVPPRFKVLSHHKPMKPVGVGMIYNCGSVLVVYIRAYIRTYIHIGTHAKYLTLNRKETEQKSSPFL